MEVTPVFSLDYQTARAQFLAAAAGAGARIDHVQNPNDGPDGRPLFADVALVGAEEARTVLVVSSGTHGVEGFAGSGIQTGLLREGLASRLPDGVRLVMIHGINPYGMAHLRRFTEDNVDLNRNFRDHDAPYPGNEDYEKLAAAIAPRSLSFWSEIGAWARLLSYRVTEGKARSQAAIQGGQYTDPGGLFFGGHDEVWSNRTVRAIVRQYLSAADRIVVVDVHTGLGAFGNAEIILNDATSSPDYQRASAIWGSAMVRSTISGESVSAHLDASLKRAFREMVPDAEVTAVSLEFGTVPPMAVFKALRAENWLHHHATGEHPDAARIKECLLRAFHPASADWEARVWDQGRGVIGEALAWLGRGASQTRRHEASAD